jgi:alpha-glucosidase
LAEQNSADHFYRTFTEFEQAVSDGWACWSFANHDVKRVASRWSDDPRALRLYASLLMTLRGSPCFYQGEELGLTEAKLTFEQLQDPYGISMWPEEGGRDGCRTPMVWDARSPNAGFSQGKPWLPIAPEHMSRAVSEQDQDPNSLLNFYRRWFEIRRVMPILWSGTIEFLPPDERVFTFIRSDGTQRLLCVFNLSDQACQYVLPQHCVIQSMAQVPQQVTPSTQAEQSDALKTVSTQDLQLSPWQTLFAWVDVAEAKQ